MDQHLTEQHRRIWHALDRLAADHGLSPSGLAKSAGLDATAFNPSKRVTRDGRLRWPGAETLAKVMAATGARLSDIAALAGEQTRVSLPVRRLSADGSLRETGESWGESWNGESWRDANDAGAFLVEIADDGRRPVYAQGDRLLVSPASPLARGDRVVLETRAGHVLLGEIVVIGPDALTMQPIGLSHRESGAQRFDRGAVAWIARVLAAHY